MNRKPIIAVLAVLAIAASSCISAMQADSAPEAFVSLESAGGDLEDTARFEGALAVERQIIVTSRIDIRAADTRGAMDEITALAARSGGFVASATVNPTARGDRPPVISMTIRIPVALIGDTMGSIREIADEVVSESLETQDVTEEYVDLEARLGNLLRLEEELVAFLTEARTNPNAETDDVLRVFLQVSDVRAQIEELEGRKRFLDDRVDLATIGISITPTSSSNPIVDEGWTPGLVLRDALRELVDSLQNVADGAIWLGVFVLPLLVVIGIPLWIGLTIWLVRRRKRKKLSGEASASAGDRLDSGSPSNSE